MEEDNQTSEDEKKFIKGYNFGYFLSKYDTEIYRHLEKTDSDKPYVRGLKAGKTQSIIDQAKSNFKDPDWLKGDTFKENMDDITKVPSKDKEKDIDRDKGRNKGFMPGF